MGTEVGVPAGRVARPHWMEARSRGGQVVVLVRHGRTAWNVERRFLGRSDLPMDEDGREQVRALARYLGAPFGILVSSPLGRAIETARLLGREPIVDGAWLEMAQGILEGLDDAEAGARHGALIEAWRADPAGVEIPGGESLDAVQERAWRALEDTPRDGDRPVGVVTHQLLIAALVCRILGQPLARWREHGVANARVTALGRPEGGSWEVLVEDWPTIEAIALPGGGRRCDDPTPRGDRART